MKSKTAAAIGLLSMMLVVDEGLAFQQFEKLQPYTIVESDGIKQPIDTWRSQYINCASNRVERGEYETKEEYAARYEKQAKKCDSLHPVKAAVISESVRLEYNADRQEFTFDLMTANTNIVNQKFYKLKADSGFVEGCLRNNYFDQRTYNQAMKIARLNVHSRYEEESCSNRHELPDNPFFEGLTVTKGALGVYHAAMSNGRYTGHFNLSENTVKSLKIKAISPIEKARQLKVIEASLRMEIEGELSWKNINNNSTEYNFILSKIRLRNLEDESVLFEIIAQ